MLKNKFFIAFVASIVMMLATFGYAASVPTANAAGDSFPPACANLLPVPGWDGHVKASQPLIDAAAGNPPGVISITATSGGLEAEICLDATAYPNGGTFWPATGMAGVSGSYPVPAGQRVSLTLPHQGVYDTEFWALGGYVTPPTPTATDTSVPTATATSTETPTTEPSATPTTTPTATATDTPVPTATVTPEPAILVLTQWGLDFECPGGGQPDFTSFQVTLTTGATQSWTTNWEPVLCGGYASGHNWNGVLTIQVETAATLVVSTEMSGEGWRVVEGGFARSLPATDTPVPTATNTPTATATDTPVPTATATQTASPTPQAPRLDVGISVVGEVVSGQYAQFDVALTNTGKDPVVGQTLEIAMRLDDVVASQDTVSANIPLRGVLVYPGSVTLTPGTHTVCATVSWHGAVIGTACTKVVVGDVKIYLPLISTPPDLEVVLIETASCPGTADGFAQINGWTNGYWGSQSARDGAARAMRSGAPIGVIAPPSGVLSFSFKVCIHPTDGRLGNGADVVLRRNGVDDWNVTGHVPPVTIATITVRDGDAVHLVDRPTR